MPLRYDLEQLRTPPEFLRLAQTLAAQTINVGSIKGRIAKNLEELVVVLEEYE
ncbi:MAG: hypothetical protein O3C43_19430 [Verrucomicrobia bacterium]|nr:hypothetical protein [Verrucomicrobiota bacterium]MDA1068663.1 hypothetical protein [Verrucomicrobiota bacterium]